MELWIDLEIAFFVKNHPPCPKQPDASVSLSTSYPEAVSCGDGRMNSGRPEMWACFDLMWPGLCFQAELPPLTGGQVETMRRSHGHVERALGWKTRG